MINFSLDTNPKGMGIEALDARGIQIGGQIHAHSLLLTAERLQPWPPQRFAELTRDHLELMLAHPADVYLLGVGAQQRFPAVDLLAVFYARGLGIEVMHSAAACRTFNILAAEGRNPVAGILWEPSV
ncbi:MAG: MTH938/NDUFAF3 family protein [Gammaproteobacteria bacterium SHHR-1]|uniref:Mth938-like domain-containing protein n=1 Tax=Magnetovirga frankeli TaxID=947516 RepID=UPI0012937C0F|nr:hypothetical protein D5125_08810 [gamma proteobacterium SS-5]